jgi:hypothetical protein
VLFDTYISSLPSPPRGDDSGDDAEQETTVLESSKLDTVVTAVPPEPRSPAGAENPSKPKPIFVGHRKNAVPLQKLQTLLSTCQVPRRVTVAEANLGRPIPQKVKDTMEYGSAILIFTRDEKFTDKDGNEIWRPSENVVYELGASSFAYGDRIVVFNKKRLDLPNQFSVDRAHRVRRGHDRLPAGVLGPHRVSRIDSVRRAGMMTEWSPQVTCRRAPFEVYVHLSQATGKRSARTMASPDRRYGPSRLADVRSFDLQLAHASVLEPCPDRAESASANVDLQ